VIVSVAVAAILLLSGGGVLYVGLGGAGPAAAYLRDSGVVMCEAMAARKADAPEAPQQNSPERLAESQYRAIRKQFSRSRYEDLRRAGTHFVDVVWQIQGAEPALLLLAGLLFSAYSDLAGACVNHDVMVPPISG